MVTTLSQQIRQQIKFKRANESRKNEHTKKRIDKTKKEIERIRRICYKLSTVTAQRYLSKQVLQYRLYCQQLKYIESLYQTVTCKRKSTTDKKNL